MDRFGHTQERLAEALGKSRSHIANLLRLLTLPEPVLELVRGGKLTAGHARALVTASHPEALARQVVEGDLSVRQTEQLARAVAPVPGAGAARRPARGQGRRHPRARGGPDGHAATEGQRSSTARASRPASSASATRRSRSSTASASCSRASGSAGHAGERDRLSAPRRAPAGRRRVARRRPAAASTSPSACKLLDPRRPAAARRPAPRSARGSTPSRRRRPIISISTACSGPETAARSDDARAVALDRLEPRLRRAQRLDRPAAAAERQPPVRAGTDAGIVAVAPVDEVVPALGARAGRGWRSRSPRARPRRRSPPWRGTCRPPPPASGRPRSRPRAARSPKRVPGLDGELVEREVVDRHAPAPGRARPARRRASGPGGRRSGRS